MHVFLSTIFCKFLLTPIFKKLDAFIPAISLLLHLLATVHFLLPIDTKKDSSQ